VTAPTTLPDLPAQQEMTVARPGRGRRIILYAATRGTTEGMRSARGLLLAIILGPRAFGIWTLFRICMRYTPLASLGVQRGLELEIVQGRAHGGTEAIARCDTSARTALGWIISTAAATSLAALIASFIVTDPAWRVALRAVSLGVVLEGLWVYATTYLRARGELRRYALLEIANASVHLVAAVGMAYLFGLRGAIAGFVIGALVSLWTVRNCAPFRPALANAPLQRLLDIGIPLALSTALTIALGTADRLVVVAYGGAATLGLYAFGVSIAGLAASLAWIIRTVIFPDVYGSARAAGAAPAMREHLDRTVLPFAYLFPPILGALALLMEPAMALALPRYLPAAEAARVFIFTAGAGGITTLGAIGVIAVGRQRALPVLSAIALCINLACSMLALHFGAGLAVVAGGAVLAQATIAAGVLTIVGAQATHERAFALVLKALLPLAWCVAAVVLMSRLYDPRTLAGGAASLGTYLLLLLPIAPLMVGGFRSARVAVPPARYTE
jgi:O-antigen/teichoic acid export membrane protein